MKWGGRSAWGVKGMLGRETRVIWQLDCRVAALLAMTGDEAPLAGARGYVRNARSFRCVRSGAPASGGPTGRNCGRMPQPRSDAGWKPALLQALSVRSAGRALNSRTGTTPGGSGLEKPATSFLRQNVGVKW